MDLYSQLSRWSQRAVIAAAIVAIALVAAADYATSPEVTFFIFYLAPPALVAWFVGQRAGIAIAALGTTAWAIAYAASTGSVKLWVFYWQASVNLLSFLFAALMAARLRAEHDKQYQLSRTDFLTGVQNSRAFYEVAESERLRSLRYGRPLCLVFVDLDDFKTINDRLGHEAGDSVLRGFAACLKTGLRRTDTVARLGGDEFVILLPETSLDAATTVVEKIRQQLLGRLSEGRWPVTTSMGVAVFEAPPDSVEEMVRFADQLAYAAKREGGNRAEIRLAGEAAAIGGA